MVTINNYAVSVSLNAGDLIDKAKLARNEIASLTRTLGSLSTPQEKFERALNLAERGLTDEAKASGALIDIKERLRLKYLGVSEAVEKQNSSLQKSSSVTSTMVSRVGALAAGYVGVRSAINLATSSVMASADVERSKAAFTVLTGSAEKARDMLSQIRDLSSRSPISFSAATQSARTLLSFNVAAQSVVPTLHMLGEITGGDTERFKMLSLAFAQSSAAGRLMGQDLLQMINAGFNPLQEISRKTGRSLVDLKKDMESGLITFDMVNDAFKSATSEGGLFNGMMGKIGETTAGSMQKANASIELLKISLGESLSPLIKEVSSDIAELAKNTDGLKGSMDGAGNSVLGFYNFIKSEISLLPTMARGFGTIGSELGNLADTFATAELFQFAKKSEPGTFVKFLEENYESRRSEIDAMLRKQAHGDYVRTDFFGSQLDRDLIEFRRRMQESADKAKETMVGQEMKPSGVTKEAEAQQKAMDGINKRYETQAQSLQTAIERLRGGKVAAAEMKSELIGLTDPQKMHITNLARELEMEEQKVKFIKDQATERERMERQAQSIRDRYATPIEKLAKSLAEIDNLRRLEILSPFEAARARQQAAAESVKGMKLEAPKAMDINSQGGADLIAEMRNREIEAKALDNAKVLNMQQQMLLAAHETNRKLDRIAEVQPRNIR